MSDDSTEWARRAGEATAWRDWQHRWSEPLAQLARVAMQQGDAAHDGEHIRRVVANVERVGVAENADPRVVLPAAWLHDCVAVAKDSPQRSSASRLAAERALVLLQEIDYPADGFAAIHHAIEAHSFSAQIAPRSLEAQVLQDADRLDAIGAIGIARCLLTGGAIDRPLYDPEDPFARRRPPNDAHFTLDHFYVKLLHLESSMQTATGRRLARQRTRFMQTFLETLGEELPGHESRSCFIAARGK